MDNLLEFMHNLHNKIIEAALTADIAIVRFDVDKETAPDSLKLVVVVDEGYFPFYVTVEDLDDLDTLTEEVLHHLLEEIQK